MTSETSVKGLLLKPIYGLGCFLMKTFLSPHTRRILFMTAIYGTIKGMDKIETNELFTVGSLMDVVYDKNALEIPALVYSYVWGDDLAKDIGIDVSSKEKFILSIHKAMDKLPSWLQYGTQGRMINDAAAIYDDVCKEMCFVN